MPFAIIAASAEGLGVIASGGDRGIRTPNLCDANAALSQLSYIPISSMIATLGIWGKLIFLSRFGVVAILP